jgi:hypothetical protein
MTSQGQKQPAGLEILEARLVPEPAGATDQAEAVGAPGRRQLAIELENPTDTPLHVWLSPSAYDWKPDTGELSLHLDEPEEAVPPGITLISHHPRTPAQETVPANSRATVTIDVPPMIRRRVSGEGMGMRAVEEPVGDVRSIRFEMRYSDAPFESPTVDESPQQHRDRLATQGNVVNRVIAVSHGGEGGTSSGQPE